MAFVEHPDVFLADFGVTCTVGAYSFKGILDQPDSVSHLGGRNIVSGGDELTCKTTDATAAAIGTGTAITCGGISYVVREVLLESDAVFTKLTLSHT